MDDIAELAALAEACAREAGALLLDGLRRQRARVGTKTSTTDMVSEMDHASEALIVARLLADRPDDAILAEEGGGRAGTSGVRWVIDPLDGTTNYLYGHPRWAVSIAAEDQRAGRVVAGAVADPSLDEVYTAHLGGGASCNGEPITHSGHTDLATALVATGFGYKRDERARQAAILTQVVPHVRDVRRHGSAALDACWVACGRVDAYYESVVQTRDVAAGGLIATEAGARYAFDGTAVVTAAPAIFDDLCDLLRRAEPAGATTRRATGR